MYDLIYSKIDDFLKDKIKKPELYIQEGSGGYYISSKVEGDLNSGTFINRIAQIIEEEGDFKLSLKDHSSGQWGEYKVFDNINDCLEEMEPFLLEYNSGSGESTAKSQEDDSRPTAVGFKCWSCDNVLLNIEAGGKGLDVHIAEELSMVEIACPSCKKAQLFDLSSERDLEAVLLHGKTHKLISTEMPTDKQKKAGIDILEASPNTVNIDFYDLLWRLKDHSYSSVHYLNVLTGRLEKVVTDGHTTKEEIRQYEGFPWLRITPVPSREAYGVMEEFVKVMTAGEAKTKLESVIMEPKPFKKFKQILQQYPETLEEWTKYETDFYMDKAKEWLDSVQISYKLIV